MAQLAGPYEIFELKDGESKELTVTRYEYGTVIIHPRYPGAPPSKEIAAVRLYIRPEEKPAGVPYWDITSQTLIAQLRPFLEAMPPTGLRIRLTAHGIPPSKRYSLEVLGP
jgi:hypothetical protein